MMQFLTLATRSMTVRLIAAILAFYLAVVVYIALSFAWVMQTPTFIPPDFEQEVANLLTDGEFDGKTVSPRLESKITDLRAAYDVAWVHIYDGDTEFSFGPVPDQINDYRALQEGRNIDTFAGGTPDIALRIQRLGHQNTACEERGTCDTILISGFTRSQIPTADIPDSSFIQLFRGLMTSSSLPLFLFGSPIILFLTVWLVTRPLRRAAQQAEKIRPSDIDIRLDEKSVPLEALPLVRSVNQALERLDRGYDTLGKFTAAAAHELRTPLALFDVHLKDVPEGEARKNLRGLVVRLQQVIDQILYLALMGRANAPLETFDLVSLTREAIADRVPMLEDDGITIELENTVEAFPMRGMKMAIYSAITNLIDNAAKHAPDGDCIRLVVHENGLDVIDHGPGLSKDFEPFAFNSFKKQDSQSVGFGLGLSIVEEIMKRHGGSVSYSPTEGGGATFSLKLASA